MLAKFIKGSNTFLIFKSKSKELSNINLIMNNTSNMRATFQRRNFVVTAEQSLDREEKQNIMC